MKRTFLMLICALAGGTVVEGADLDALIDKMAGAYGGRTNLEAWKAIENTGLELWLDAGVGNPQSYLALSDSLASHSIKARIVVGLESLQDPDDSRWSDALDRRPTGTATAI